MYTTWLQSTWTFATVALATVPLPLETMHVCPDGCVEMVTL